MTPDDQAEEDEIIDFDAEEVLDLRDVSDSSSAIEGVEMLDFLEDDDSSSKRPSAPLEPTIDISAEDINIPANATSAEIDNLDDLDLVEVVDFEDPAPDDANDATSVVDLGHFADLPDDESDVSEPDEADSDGDAITPAEPRETQKPVADVKSSDEEFADIFADVGPSEPTVNYNREATAITDRVRASETPPADDAEQANRQETPAPEKARTAASSKRKSPPKQR